MSSKVLFISPNCSHCKNILIGFKKHPFLINLFTIVNVNEEKYPPYIKSVPSLLIGTEIIKGDTLFEYFGKLVDEKLKQENRINNNNIQESDQGQCRINENGELEGWCSSGGSIEFSMISENNDNFTNSVHKFNTNLEFINDNNLDNQNSLTNQIKTLESKDNQLMEKRNKFDSDLEKLQSLRNNTISLQR